MTNPVAWQLQAACKDVARDLGSISIFWGNSTKWRPYCASCPVAWTCLQYAVEGDEREGVYGGMGGEARRTFLSRFGDDPTSEEAFDYHLNLLENLRRLTANDDRNIRLR